MTHTLHREGDRDSLEADFVVLAHTAAGYNVDGSATAVRAFLELAKKHGADTNNIGIEAGSIYQMDYETMEAEVSDEVSNPHAVFEDVDALEAFLTDLCRLDLGISTVVSGLFDRTETVCENVRERIDEGAEPRPHTARKWLGVYGNRKRLPEKPVRDVSTMCGHAMVSFSLVREMRDAVAEGRLDARSAAERLAEPCVCGVFNVERAQALLEGMANERAD
ncbi:MAG: hypothetical protein ACOCY7_02755 [Halodesulfurarchaeum sp.]